jgi:HlyD family secretion protein
MVVQPMAETTTPQQAPAPPPQPAATQARRRPPFRASLDEIIVHIRALPRWLRLWGLGVVALLIVWFIYERIVAGSSPTIAGSGTIEAIQVDVAPKVSGRIQALLVRDGDAVKAGQPIAQIERVDAQLALQQANANLKASQARLRLAQASYALQRDVNTSGVSEARAQVQATAARVPQSVTLAGIQAQSVSAQVDAATAHLRSASAMLETARATLASASADITNMQAADRLAQANLKRTHQLYQDGDVSAQAYDTSRSAAQSAHAQVAASLGRRDAAAKQVAAAEANLREAHANLDLAIASEQTVAVKQMDITASSAQLEQSKAVLAGAQAQSHALDQRRADIDLAQADVAQATAAVAIAQRQLGETTLYAPFDGIVLSHSAEVGDLVVPQATVMTISDADHPYLDLYATDADLARVKVGQAVDVRVDGAPGRIFQGRVTSIRTTAEFTPSNVQTKEQRAELVFRVRIDLPNQDGTLKAGMPADGVIHTGR